MAEANVNLTVELVEIEELETKIAPSASVPVDVDTY